MTPSWRHDACSSLSGTRERFTCWARVTYLWTQKRICEREKRTSVLGWNMDMQTFIHFALEQMNGSAYSTFKSIERGTIDLILIFSFCYLVTISFQCQSFKWTVFFVFFNMKKKYLVTIIGITLLFWTVVRLGLLMALRAESQG